MPRLSIWNSGRKGPDYKFFDRTISEYFGAGGTCVYAHLYIGPYDQTPATAAPNYNDTATDSGGLFTPPLPGVTSSSAPGVGVRSVEDVLFLENRDRRYSTTVFELRGIYNVTDSDFDLRQFGLFLAGDTLFIEFHLNDMIGLLGRRLIPGDVLELPHQRDDTIPGGLLAMNKFYVVEDANRASDGYSATWFPHIWRVKVAPMPASQEFEDILGQNQTNPLGLPGSSIGSLMTTLATDLGLNEQIVQSAIAEVPKRFFETQQFWFCPTPHDYTGSTLPWIFAGGGDAIPPNGASLLGSGTSFPLNPAIGAYYLRSDYMPPALFRWDSRRWAMQEVDWRGTEWSVAHRHLKSFINDDATTTLDDGTVVPQKQNLSQAIKPRADF